MKVAIVYWGILRCVDKTEANREKYIYKTLRENGVEYKTYCHNYHLNSNYENKRAKEQCMKIDEHAQRKLLNPDYYLIDDRSKVIKSLEADMKIYLRYGNPWGKFNDTFLYHILAMRSKYEITMLLQKHIEDGADYDLVLFLRSDVIFEPFNIMKILQRLQKSSSNTVIIPNFGHGHGYNDRLIICRPEIAMKYGLVYKDMKNIVNYAVKPRRNPLHSETLVKYILSKANATVVKDPLIKFCRIRTNGYVHANDYRE